MRKIDIIGMPMKYGCFVEGADLAFSPMKDSYKRILNPKNINPYLIQNNDTVPKNTTVIKPNIKNIIIKIAKIFNKNLIILPNKLIIEFVLCLASLIIIFSCFSLL